MNGLRDTSEQRCWNLRAISAALNIIGDQYVIENYTSKVLVPLLVYLSEQIEENIEHIEKEMFGEDYDGGWWPDNLEKPSASLSRGSAASEINAEAAS
jgi:hypothetical protein